MCTWNEHFIHEIRKKSVDHVSHTNTMHVQGKREIMEKGKEGVRKTPPKKSGQKKEINIATKME